MPEVLVKVHATVGGWRDGDIIAVQPDGLLIPNTEIDDWLTNGNAPPTVANLTRYRRQQMTKRLREIRVLDRRSPTFIANLFYPDWATLPVGFKQQAIAEIQKEKQINSTKIIPKALQYGIDSVWGWSDMTNHFAVTVSDIAFGDDQEFLVSEQDENVRREWKGKRRSWRGLFRPLVSGRTEADIDDNTKLVRIRRDRPTTKGVLMSYEPQPLDAPQTDDLPPQEDRF